MRSFFEENGGMTAFLSELQKYLEKGIESTKRKAYDDGLSAFLTFN